MKSSTIITVRKKNERLKQQQKIGLAAIIKSRHKKVSTITTIGKHK